MSANNNDEMAADSEDSSTRLRDRAQSGLNRAQEGSTRLRDRTSSAFQRRRQQAQEAREAISDGTSDFADALELSPGNVEPVQLDDRGEEFGFVPTEQGRETLAERFAEDRPFVDADDALVEADPREGVRPQVNPDRAADVAADAREQTAADDEYTQPDDLDAEVGAAGVENIELTEAGARRRAGRAFEAETPLESVDPQTDVTPTGDGGFGLNTRAERRAAARGFEDRTDTFGQGDLDPSSDVRETGDGFGLAEGPARELAADRIDADLPDVAVGPGDVELERTGTGDFEASFEREVRR